MDALYEFVEAFQNLSDNDKGSEHMYLGDEPMTPPAFLEEGV